jgi:hypothetical protein
MNGQRPCLCDNYRPDQPWDPTQCRRCYLFHMDPRYHRRWGGIEPPSPAQQGLALLRATASHLAAGLPRVDEPTYRQRLTICQGCEFFLAFSCQKCGCNLKVKAWWQEQKCPQGYW